MLSSTAAQFTLARNSSSSASSDVARCSRVRWDGLGLRVFCLPLAHSLPARRRRSRRGARVPPRAAAAQRLPLQPHGASGSGFSLFAIVHVPRCEGAYCGWRAWLLWELRATGAGSRSDANALRRSNRAPLPRARGGAGSRHRRSSPRERSGSGRSVPRPRTGCGYRRTPSLPTSLGNGGADDRFAGVWLLFLDDEIGPCSGRDRAPPPLITHGLRMFARRSSAPVGPALPPTLLVKQCRNATVKPATFAASCLASAASAVDHCERAESADWMRQASRLQETKRFILFSASAA